MNLSTSAGVMQRFSFEVCLIGESSLFVDSQ